MEWPPKADWTGDDITTWHVKRQSYLVFIPIILYIELTIYKSTRHIDCRVTTFLFTIYESLFSSQRSKINGTVFIIKQLERNIWFIKLFRNQLFAAETK